MSDTTRCEPADAIEAAGDAIIASLRGRRGFASLIDDIDDEILAELKVMVGLKAVRAYVEAAPAAPPGLVRALVEALERIEKRRARHIIPWTHEAAADEYALMLDSDRLEARAALAAYRRQA